MTTPIQEKDQYSFPAFNPNRPAIHQPHEPQSSDEDGTLQEESHEDYNHLRVTTSYGKGPEHLHRRDASPLSPSAQREASRRLDDELELLEAERLVSNAEKSQHDINRSKSLGRSRSRGPGEPIDDFDVGTTPIHETAKVYQPPANPTTSFAKVFKRIHNSSFIVRWICYIAPVTILLLIPVLLGSLKFTEVGVGGVELFWFGIWLEIVWLTLWAGRLLAKCIPYPMGVISSAFTNNSKKWRDLGKALEIPATIFFWGLAIEISFLPTMKNHHVNGNPESSNWESIVNKIIISFFVACVLNFVEKIIIQLIAISFHLRTYADRIEINKFQNSSLVKLYIYSKEKIALEDSEFEVETGPASGTRTPMAYVNKAQQKSRKVFNRVGDVAGKVAGDFTGKAVASSNHPHQVVLQLLSSTTGAQVLARRLYRTFVHEDSETVLSDDLRPAFDNDDEANAAFTMFDKDLNGDISMEELEAVCVEIGRERKAITASLKDLDSVVSKLDSVFVFIVAVITILVFVSIISTSASGVLTSLGSSVLALSWLFAATAQEFLQSIIFVFVKHPFDVGDRVTIYGNTGSDMKGDDYFVKEIALLYTEFKKMEGHVVQAPNSYLNTLFILNQRRSGGLAEAVPVTIKFGTTLEQIDTLRARLLEFVTSEKREYQKNILTELRQVFEAHSITLNVVFFYKSNWQNELLRLQRRNKFICAMMVIMNELGIEGPRMRLAGATPDFPMHLHNAYTGTQPYGPYGPHGPVTPAEREGSTVPDSEFRTIPEEGEYAPKSHPSILRKGSVMAGSNDNGRRRGESISAMGKRVDFSLGMSSISSGDQFGDVFDDPKPRLPNPSIYHTSPSPGRGGRASEDNESLAKTSSRESHAGSNRTHRNRFFSRKSRLSQDDGTSLEDLEAGTVRRDISTHDMPDIPEASGANSTVHRRSPSGHENAEGEKFAGVDRIDAGTRDRNGTQSSGMGMGKMDSRTGLVSSQAVARDSTSDREEFPLASLHR